MRTPPQKTFRGEGKNGKIEEYQGNFGIFRTKIFSKDGCDIEKTKSKEP